MLEGLKLECIPPSLLQSIDFIGKTQTFWTPMLHGFLFSWERGSVRMETEIISNEKKMSPTKRWKYSRRDCTKLCILDINFFTVDFGSPYLDHFKSFLDLLNVGPPSQAQLFPTATSVPGVGPICPSPKTAWSNLSHVISTVFFLFFILFGRKSSLY